MNFLETLRRRALIALLAALSFIAVSCGDDNDDGGSGSGSGQSSTERNDNANTVTTERAVTRLEFPALKKEGRQKIIVHRLSNTSYDKDAINFCTEWDCDLKSQRWSCYQLHQGFTGGYSRVADFTFDPDLSPSDYYSEYLFFPGFQRGHICPSYDRTFSQEANTQTFYMSNMQPQYGTFNASSGSNVGLWLRMERILQKWAKSLSATDTIFVCKGGTIDKSENIIKRIDGKLIVPKYFFMAILRKTKFGYAAMGFWSEQTNEWRTNETLLSHAMSIDELEQLTGLDFFCNLPDKTEREVEARFTPSVWAELR